MLANISLEWIINISLGKECDRRDMSEVVSFLHKHENILSKHKVRINKEKKIYILF
jgi:hypothetical protein